MFKNLLIVAFRNLNKFRFYSLVNVFGLTVGLTTCLVILLFIRFELSYDRFNEKADRIVRVDWELLFGGTLNYQASVTPPMAETLVRDYPEVEAATRFRYNGAAQWKRELENTVEWRMVYADSDLFKIFTIPFIAGNPGNALKDPNSMVITEECAKQFFPGEEALGKTLVKDNSTVYKITGVVKDLPDNSHFHYRMFLSMEGLSESKNGNWIGGPFNTYLLLKEGARASDLEAKLPGMVEKYLVPYAAAVLGATFMDDFRKEGNKLQLHLRPLTDIHLHSHLRNELQGNGDIYYVYLLGAIAIFILGIAVINFTNLATARSLKRAREVGIRKVMGSSRTGLATQFIGESVLLSLIAFVLSLGLTYLAIPLFNYLTEMHLTVPNDPQLLLIITAAAMGVGVLAGIYPGVVLSAFQPAEVLKGKMSTGHGTSFLRSGLVVFQFGISIFLIVATLALYQQLNFVQSRKVGFDRDQVILVRDVKNFGARLEAIRDEVAKNSFVRGGTISSYFPGPGSARKTPLIWQYGSTPTPDNSINAEKWTVDYDYVPTLGMEISEGRNFSREFPSDSSAVILNETAVKRMGFSGSPIGSKVSLFHDNPDGSQDRSRLEAWTVIGVVKDFNFESLRQGVTPLGLFFGTDSRGSIAFRYEAEHTADVISALQKTWKNFAPGEPLNYTFLDQEFGKMYSSEQKLGRVFVVFSTLAIILASLGLFALTAFTVEQRTKEIGIRKVLGANPGSVVLLLSKEFSKLILFGFVLAAPVAAYAIYWYLQQYAYRTEISPILYIIAGASAFLLAGLTIGYQSIKAALGNPVDALRAE